MNLKLIKKYILIFSLLLFKFSVSYPQGNWINYAKIEEGIRIVPPMMEKKMKKDTRFVALGVVQPLIRESIKLNYAISAYLIQNKEFTHYLLNVPDWTVREMNEYLLGTKVYNQNEFDRIYEITFEGTEYFNEESKDFFRWLKQYNEGNKNGKVRILGVQFVISSAGKFPTMNDKFIKKFIRPYNEAIADSMKANWMKIGNSASIESDSLILKYMMTWERFAEKHNLMPAELFNLMKNEIEQRMLAYKLIKSDGTELQRYHQMLTLMSAIERDYVNRLLENPTGKIVFSSANTNFIDAQVFMVDPTDKKLPIPTNGSYYRAQYKDGYLNTVISFSETAEVTGIKDGIPFQPIVVNGGEVEKKLAKERHVYYLPEDKKILNEFKIPLIPSGVMMDATPVIEPNDASRLFDILFIFKNLIRVNVLNK